MESFESTFDAPTRARLVGSLVLVCGDRATAEDLAQDALATAWSRWRWVARKDSPKAWVWRCAFNAAASNGRRQAAGHRALDRLSSAPWPPALPDESDRLALRSAVLGLAERQRLAIVCRYYADLTVAESAKVMGCRPGTVKALTSQAIERLRDLDLIERNQSGAEPSLTPMAAATTEEPPDAATR